MIEVRLWYMARAVGELARGEGRSVALIQKCFAFIGAADSLARRWSAPVPQATW
jgi:hypothetical protein